MGIYIYNSDQIKKIENACLITANVLDEIEPKIVEGISTFEIDLYARKLMEQHKVKPAFLGYGGFPAVACISVNEEVIHGIPRHDCILKEGDIVGVDMGVVADGYFGDSARTYVVGSTFEDAQKLIDVTKKSLYKGIEKAVVGNRISDISHAVESFILPFGYSAVKEFSGHGLGKHLHEEPSIPNYGRPGKGPRIKNGMVFAIEPMINLGGCEVDILEDEWTVVTRDGKVSAHFEHTIAIVNDKPKILTRGKHYN